MRVVSHQEILSGRVRLIIIAIIISSKFSVLKYEFHVKCHALTFINEKQCNLSQLNDIFWKLVVHYDLASGPAINKLTIFCKFCQSSMLQCNIKSGVNFLALAPALSIIFAKNICFGLGPSPGAKCCMITDQ